MGALRASTRVIAYIKIAILARLLVPEQFGIFGIAALALALLEILTETGINVFFIQREGKIEEYIDTAWFVSILRGILISLLIVLTASPVSLFFNSPDSYKLLLLIGTVPFLRGFINPAIVKFQKELQFNKEFFLRFSIFSFDATVAILIAFFTRSAVSLVWGLIAGVLLEIFLSHWLIEPRPKFVFEYPKVKRVVGRGKWVTIYSVFNYIFENGDDIVVGRLLNTFSLGLYQVAYKISTLPITEIANVFVKVSFPIYTKISGHTKRLKKAYLKTMLAISLLVIPLGLIIFLFPEVIIKVILGNKWLDAAPVLRILAIFGMIRAITLSGYTLFLAAKKQEYVTASTFAGILGLGVTVIPMVRKYGILGAGFSALIGTLVSIPIFIFFLFRTFRALEVNEKN